MGVKKTLRENAYSAQCTVLCLICWFYVQDCDVGFDKASVSSFSLLSRKQPNSLGVLSAQYCNTSHGDWHKDRWSCQIFVKESTKCSLQLTSSSDIFLSDIPSLSLPAVDARFIWERHMACYTSL